MAMRNTEKYPQNLNTVTIYLSNDTLKELDRVCELTVLSRGKVINRMATECLPKAKMTERRIYTLSFE